MECLKEKRLRASNMAEPNPSSLYFLRDPSHNIYFQAPTLLLSEIASSFPGSEGQSHLMGGNTERCGIPHITLTLAGLVLEAQESLGKPSLEPTPFTVSRPPPPSMPRYFKLLTVLAAPTFFIPIPSALCSLASALLHPLKLLLPRASNLVPNSGPFLSVYLSSEHRIP